VADPVLGEKVFEDTIPVFSRETDGVQLDSESLSDGPGIGEILRCRAVTLFIVFIPVLHEQAFYLVALFEQQGGRDCGINASGKTHDNLIRFHKVSRSVSNSSG